MTKFKSIYNSEKFSVKRKENRNYVIIPSCSDLNRGDQALVWETKRLAEECGFTGTYYMIAEQNESVSQSRHKGLEVIIPQIEHPSRKFKNKENVTYTRLLTLKWGFVAFGDFIISLLMLFKCTRKIIKEFLSKEKKLSYEIMENADAVFMKGGGLIQTYGGITSTYSVYFWVYPIFLASRLGKPIYILPNSFGPFEGPFVKGIARAALKKCRMVTSRETLSQNMVRKELGIKIDNYPDLAFCLSKAERSKKDLYEKYNLPVNRKLVALTMRPYRFPHNENPQIAYWSYKKELAEFIEWLYENNYMPVLVEHTLAVNSHENDRACIKDVAALLKKNTYRLIMERDYDCTDLKFLYGCCDYIIGTRFHSMIFGFASNVPGIAISYTGNKTRGIMRDMGLEEYVLDIEEVSFLKLKEKFMILINDEKNVKQKIDSYREKAEEGRRQMTEILRRESHHA